MMMSKKVLLLLLIPVLSLAATACGGGAGDPVNVPEPYILSISTDYDGKAVAGKPVTLNGLNFSPVASENKVVYGVGFDTVSLSVDEASEEHLVFTAPEVDKKQLRILVSTRGMESNSVTLEYTTAPVNPTDPTEDPWDDTPTINLPGATTVTICPGVEWTSFHGSWEGRIRNINIIRTTLNEHNKLGIYFSFRDNSYPADYPKCEDGEDPRDLDKKCIWLDAVAGTNGPMGCCQFVRVNGELRNSPSSKQDPWIANCALTIDGDVVDIVRVQDNAKASRLTNAADGNSDYPANTLTVGCAGPLLVWEGVVQKCSQEWLKADTKSWLTKEHPRTAIGLSKDGKTVVQVAVDGRWDNSSLGKDKMAYGMPTDLLGKMMRQLGCYKAMNFDGGGGTAMWVYGQGNARNIVNRVSENTMDADNNYIWDWEGTKLRPTGAAVYIKSDLKK